MSIESGDRALKVTSADAENCALKWTVLNVSQGDRVTSDGIVALPIKRAPLITDRGVSGNSADGEKVFCVPKKIPSDVHCTGHLRIQASSDSLDTITLLEGQNEARDNFYLATNEGYSYGYTYLYSQSTANVLAGRSVFQFGDDYDRLYINVETDAYHDIRTSDLEPAPSFDATATLYYSKQETYNTVVSSSYSGNSLVSQRGDAIQSFTRTVSYSETNNNINHYVDISSYIGEIGMLTIIADPILSGDFSLLSPILDAWEFSDNEKFYFNAVLLRYYFRRRADNQWFVKSNRFASCSATSIADEDLPPEIPTA